VPPLYDAMFTHAVDLSFATPEAPPALKAAFGELLEVVRPLAGDDDLATRAETFWSGLHGLMTLMRSGRLRREDHDKRLAILISRFAH
jgi:Tetracyclin repressor-like, C-terminal domain